MSTRIPSVVMAAGLAAAVSGAAIAQSDRRGFVQVRPLESSEAQPEARSEVRIFMRGEQSVNGDTIVFEYDNGEMRATINGKKVPPDRIRKEGSTVIVLDDEGNEAARFSFAAGGGGGRLWVPSGDDPIRLSPPGRGRLLIEREGDANQFVPSPDEVTPPVMIGITMSELPDEVRQHLGLGEGEGFRIDRVMKGLPGEKAGLKEADVVVAIDGRRPATMQGLREALMDRKPGDKVELTIMRQGAKQVVRVELAAWDADALGQAPAPQTFEFAFPEGQFERFDRPGDWEEQFSQAFEQAMKSLKHHNIPEEAQRAIEEAFKGAFKDFDGQRWEFRMDDDHRFLFGDRPGQLFVVPHDPPAPPGVSPGRDATPGHPPARAEIDALREEIRRVTEEREKLSKELAEIKGMLKELLNKKQ